MLKQCFQYLDFHKQAMQNSLRQMLQSPASALSTLLVLAITLTLPALFWTASDNLKRLGSQWNAQGQLTVYFDTKLNENQLNALQAKIHNISGIADTRFISARAGLEQLKRQEGMQHVLDDLPDNVLPAATVVIPNLDRQTHPALLQLQQTLQNIDGVETVKMDIQWIHRLQAILHAAHQIANLIILILGVAVILIISNTLRLAIQNNQDEVRILKLIGASDRFILRPFLYAGIFYGLFAAIIAVLLSNVCLSLIALSVKPLAKLYEIPWSLNHASLREMITILLFSIALGWLAALISVKRQLREIEPEI